MLFYTASIFPLVFSQTEFAYHYSSTQFRAHPLFRLCVRLHGLLLINTGNSVAYRQPLQCLFALRSLPSKGRQVKAQRARCASSLKGGDDGSGWVVIWRSTNEGILVITAMRSGRFGGELFSPPSRSGRLLSVRRAVPHISLCLSLGRSARRVRSLFLSGIRTSHKCEEAFIAALPPICFQRTPIVYGKQGKQGKHSCHVAKKH